MVRGMRGRGALVEGMQATARPKQTLLWSDTRQQIADGHSRVVGLSFNFLRASNIDHCSGVRDGRFPLPIGGSMEYRGIEYTVVRDERGDWGWAVSLGNPETQRSRLCRERWRTRALHHHRRALPAALALTIPASRERCRTTDVPEDHRTAWLEAQAADDLGRVTPFQLNRRRHGARGAGRPSA